MTSPTLEVESYCRRCLRDCAEEHRNWLTTNERTQQFTLVFSYRPGFDQARRQTLFRRARDKRVGAAGAIAASRYLARLNPERLRVDPRHYAQMVSTSA